MKAAGIGGIEVQRFIRWFSMIPPPASRPFHSFLTKFIER